MKGELASTLGRQRTGRWESALALAFGHAVTLIRISYAVPDKALAADQICAENGLWQMPRVLLSGYCPKQAER